MLSLITPSNSLLLSWMDRFKPFIVLIHVKNFQTNSFLDVNSCRFFTIYLSFLSLKNPSIQLFYYLTYKPYFVTVSLQNSQSSVSIVLAGDCWRKKKQQKEKDEPSESLNTCHCLNGTCTFERPEFVAQWTRNNCQQKWVRQFNTEQCLQPVCHSFLLEENPKPKAGWKPFQTSLTTPKKHDTDEKECERNKTKKTFIWSNCTTQ